MSKIEELIQELCPNGVEYKKIGEVSSFRRGSFPQPYGNSKWYDGDGAMPFVQVADIRDDMRLVDNTKRKISLLAQPKSVFAPKGTIIVSLQGSIGKVAITQYDAYIDRTVAIFSDLCKEINPKYFVYQLETIFLEKKKTARGSTIKTITKEEFTEFSFALPPRPIQDEIVRILDNFTELTARKQQYEYYRDKLLSCNNCNIPLFELRDIIKNSCSGSTPSKGNAEYYTNGTIPWIRTQNVHFNEITEVDSYITEKAVKETAVKWIPENCVIVAISGATAGRCAINKIKATTNQHCLNLEIDETKALYKYIYYCVHNKYDELISRKQGARGDLNSSLVLSLKLPIPSLEVQNRLVEVLDNFESICSDLNIGLPAEIEARQKQYEYYRDSLLSFPEKQVGGGTR